MDSRFHKVSTATFCMAFLLCYPLTADTSLTPRKVMVKLYLAEYPEEKSLGDVLKLTPFIPNDSAKQANKAKVYRFLGGDFLNLNYDSTTFVYLAVKTEEVKNFQTPDGEQVHTLFISAFENIPYTTLVAQQSLIAQGPLPQLSSDSDEQIERPVAPKITNRVRLYIANRTGRTFGGEGEGRYLYTVWEGDAHKAPYKALIKWPVDQEPARRKSRKLSATSLAKYKITVYREYHGNHHKVGTFTFKIWVSPFPNNTSEANTHIINNYDGEKVELYYAYPLNDSDVPDIPDTSITSTLNYAYVYFGKISKKNWLAK